MRTVIQDETVYQFKSAKLPWIVYYNHESYLKFSNSLTNAEHQTYKKILELLSKEEYHIKGLPKILEILSKDEYLAAGLPKTIGIKDNNYNFLAYRIELIPGIHLHKYIHESSDPLESFYRISQTLIPILIKGSEKNLVFKDLITLGNTLYNKETNQTSIVDLDGIQVEEFSDTLMRDEIIRSNIYDPIIISSKYTYDHTRLKKSALNYLLFYELFLNTVFNQSIFQIMISKNSQYPIEEVQKNLIELLTDCGIPKESNLFGRIMDLTNLSEKNSVDIQDFKEVAELSFDKSRKRIIH